VVAGSGSIVTTGVTTGAVTGSATLFEPSGGAGADSRVRDSGAAGSTCGGRPSAMIGGRVGRSAVAPEYERKYE
jgi:hypothetical protein